MDRVYWHQYKIETAIIISREWVTGVLLGWLHLRGLVAAMLLKKVKLTCCA
jgi:hypothetical protein